MLEVKNYRLYAAALLAGSLTLGSYGVKAEDQTSTTSKNWEYTASMGYASQHISANSGGIPIAGKSLQGGITASHKDGYYLGGWGNYPFEPTKDGPATREIDVFIGKKTPAWGGAIIDIGLVNWHLREKIEGENTNNYNTLYPYISVSRPFENILGITTVKAEINGNIQIDNPDLSDCANAVIGINHEAPKIFGTTFSGGGEVFRNKGCPGGDGKDLRLSAGWDITDKSRLVVDAYRYMPAKAKDTFAVFIRGEYKL